MPPTMALGGISGKRFKRESPNSTHFFSLTTSRTNPRDTAWQAAPGRPQNSIKYCPNGCGRQKSRIIRPVYIQPSRITKFYMDTHNDPVYNCTGYEIISYYLSAFIEVRKKNENVASDDFGSNFSGALPGPTN